MKNLLILACLISFTALTSLSGQSQSVPADRRALAQTEMLARQLGLTPQERKAVYQVELRYEHISDSLRSTISDMEERGKTFARYRDLKDKDLKGVLTTDHYQQYIDNRSKARARAQEEVRPQTTN